MTELESCSNTSVDLSFEPSRLVYILSSSMFLSFGATGVALTLVLLAGLRVSMSVPFAGKR